MKKKKSNAGRKPIEDKKEEVRLFVERSKIAKLGGIVGIREIAYKAINKEMAKKK